MPVFRVERTRDYTVMSSYHLRDKRLTLKAKGLLSQMLSLPEDWDYTLSGLSHINRESKNAIRSAVNELERAGYIHRRQTTDAGGKFSTNEYVIHKHPDQPEPLLEKPLSENPTPENPSPVKPSPVKPSPENPTQLNTKKASKEKPNTDGQSTDSIAFREDAAGGPPKPKGRGIASMEEIEGYRSLILENIEYDFIKQDYGLYLADLDEIVEIMVETVCARRRYTRVAGSDFPHEVVKSRLLKLNGEHIRFVMDCMKENTTKIRNIKQYLLTALFNAPTTIGNYYSSLVNHDMYGSP